MIATSEILEDIADMLAIDYVDDDEKTRVIKKLGHYVAAAEAYLTSAGITVDYEKDARILDAVTMYAGRRFDDPAQTTSYPDNAGMSLAALMEQIRLDQVVAKEAAESESAGTSTDTSAGGVDTSTGTSSDTSDTTTETTDTTSKDGG